MLLRLLAWRERPAREMVMVVHTVVEQRVGMPGSVACVKEHSEAGVVQHKVPSDEPQLRLPGETV